MDSPLGRTLGEYPRWTGDFTLPRLRAKLANKNFLHPDVEPDYLEIYRSDLRQLAMVRNPDGPPDLFGATWAPGGFERAGSTSQIAGCGKRWHVTRDPAATAVPAWRSALSQPRHVPRSGSVPALGLRRMERAPASMVPLPPEVSRSQKALPRSPGGAGGPQLGPSVAVSPSGIPIPPHSEERKEMDRERSVLGASKRLWGAVHGLEPLFDRFLIDTREEDPNIQNTKLLSLLSKEPFPAIKLALKAGADLNWRNPEWDGATLLVKSARTGAYGVVMYLLAIGADYTAVDDCGRGVLHWAALEGSAPLVEYFLENLPEGYGAQCANAPDHGGDCPLHLAAYGGHLPVVLLLARAGADQTLVNAGGHTPVDLAQAARMWEVFNCLVERGRKEGGGAGRAETGAAPASGSLGQNQIRDLLRPYDQSRAEQVREAMKDMKLKNSPDLSLMFEPKPKVKKEEKKKDDKSKAKKK